ncbi:MAG: TonB-dependent receptor [bacterium]|nr:TonB-dependent receptor [bacterium]
MKFSFKTPVVVFLFLIFILSAFSEGMNEEEYLNIGEIYVVGTPEFDNREIIEEKEFKAMNPVTIDQAIETVPGVDVSVGQKNSYELTLRGISQSKISLMLDGIPLYEPYYYETDLSMVNLSAVSQLSVSKGYASAEYGANTLGGVINMITKESSDTPVLSISASFGNNNTIYSDILTSKSFGKLDILFGLNYGKSDGYSLSKDYEENINEDGDVRENSNFDKLGTTLRFAYHPIENSTIAFSNYYFSGTKGLPWDEEAERDPWRYFNEPRYWDFSEYLKNINALDFNFVFENFQIKEKIYHIKTDNTLDMYVDKDFEELAESDTFDDYTFGHKFGLVLFNENNSEFTMGFAYRKDFHKKIADSFFYDEIEYDEISQEIYTVYAENRAYFFDSNLYIQLGMNYDTLRSRGYKVWMEGDTDIEEADGKPIDSYNPNLLVSWNILEPVTIGTSIQKKTHYPSMNQMANNLDLGLDITELRPESSVNKEVFVQAKFDKYSAKLSVYHYDIKDLIERDDKGEPYFNLQSAVITGSEISVSGKPFEFFSFNLGYSMNNPMSETGEENPGGYMEELPYTPKTTIFVGLNFSYFVDLNLNIRSHQLAYEYFNIAEWGDPDLWVKEEIPAFTVIDLKLQKTFFEHYTAFVIARNLLDVDYYEESYFPAPGLNWQVGFKYEF